MKRFWCLSCDIIQNPQSALDYYSIDILKWLFCNKSSVNCKSFLSKLFLVVLMHIPKENHCKVEHKSFPFWVWYCEKYNKNFYRYLLCQAFRSLFFSYSLQWKFIWLCYWENFVGGSKDDVTTFFVIFHFNSLASFGWK